MDSGNILFFIIISYWIQGVSQQQSQLWQNGNNRGNTTTNGAFNCNQQQQRSWDNWQQQQIPWQIQQPTAGNNYGGNAGQQPSTNLWHLPQQQQQVYFFYLPIWRFFIV